MEASLEVVSACGGLLFAAPDRPEKALVDGLIVFADQVEQASDFGDGERDQATGSA